MLLGGMMPFAAPAQTAGGAVFSADPGSSRIDPAFSPDLFRTDVAGNRSDPAFARRPLRLGALLADIHVNTEVRYESNLFNASEGKKDAASVAFQPVAEVRLDQPRTVVALRASGRAERVPAFPDQDHESYDVAFAARQDVSRSLRFALALQAGREVEERGIAGIVPNEARPALLDVLRGRVGASLERASWTMDVSGRAERRRYGAITQEDDISVSQSFRNMSTLGGTARFEWQAAPLTRLFAEADFVGTASPDAAPAQRRDARGWSMRAGLRVDGRAAGFSPLTPAKWLLDTDRLAGQWAVGWRKRDYERPVFRDYDGFIWDVTLDWYPVRRVTLRLESGQEFRNSNIPAVASVAVRSATASLYYDVQRRIRLRAGAGYERERYREIGAEAERLTARAEMLCALGPRLSARVFASWRQRRSNDARFNSFGGMSSGLAITGWFR